MKCFAYKSKRRLFEFTICRKRHGVGEVSKNYRIALNVMWIWDESALGWRFVIVHRMTLKGRCYVILCSCRECSEKVL